ncbi:hypothetical protein BST81_01075 [Leptolyngbya sp. 'hensonii']|uniref:serine/threonine-protein kinase n=1 Tax=Leptolyngbya sp. 'hensonii' TaxID=1922337 RepID=UPI00094FF21B|nr:serine/threonine-protein kinase [Leptolyngbya sp. 'hensonii']OLP20356.1 hypothetical protein BST81_01075 [Leptolyngbya sp. 'hensonii']
MLERTLGGRYQIVRHLGGGGFGQTFLARDLHLPNQPACVVKQLKPKTSSPIALQTARSLFNKEAEVLYILGEHDRIPRLFAHFEENREFYLVQEFVEGQTLNQEIVVGNTLRASQVLEILVDVLQTLQFVHQQQVIHRDIKPSNLIRRQEDGRIVLIDFGAVKQMGIPVIENYDPTTLTIAIGSPGFTPNEQIAGKPRFSSDLYALGVLCICALTGVGSQQLREDPRTSELLWRDSVEIDPHLADVLDRMVRFDFRQRYQSAGEVLQALQPLIEPMILPAAEGPPAPGITPVDAEFYLVWLERGDELFQSQRYEDAISAYDKVIQIRPEEYLAWFKRGIVLETLNQYEQALGAYDRVIQLRPKDYLAWLKRGKVLENLHQYEEAVAAYDQVVQIQPNNYWAWCDKGRVLETLHQYEAGATAFDRAVQLKADFRVAIEGRKRVLVALDQIDTLYHLEHYEEVLVSCQRLTQAQPQNCHAWLMLGMALEKLQQYEQALAAYHQVVQLQPEDSMAWFNQAKVLEKLHRYQEAAMTYEQVVQLQPGHYWSWYDRGRMLEKLQQYEAAIAAFDQAVRLKSDFQPAVEARKQVLGMLSRSEQISRSRGAHPGDSQLIWLHRGMALETEHRYEEALVAYRQAIILKENGVEVWRRQGQLLYQLGHFEETVAAYEQVVNLDPEDGSAWFCMGGALARLKRFRAAVAAFDRAIQVNPERAEFWYWRGRGLQELQDYGEALVCHEQAIALNPAFQAALASRQQVLARLGRSVKTTEAL